MRFYNEDGEAMDIADNLTLKELNDMGISVSLSEDDDPEQQIWLSDEDE
ncbi:MULTISPECIES: hypothetical protein [Aliagarivorans]|nr:MULTISPECIES: hypothetical protein [Aliagarivorans]